MNYIFDVIFSILGLKFMNESNVWYKSLLKMIFLLNFVVFSTFLTVAYKRSEPIEFPWLEILANGLLVGTILGVIAWSFAQLVYFLFRD